MNHVRNGSSHNHDDNKNMNRNNLESQRMKHVLVKEVAVIVVVPIQERKLNLSGQEAIIVIVTAVVTVGALTRVKTGGAQMIDHMVNILRPNSMTDGEPGAEKKEVITGIMFRNFVLNNLMLLIVPTGVVPQQANRFGTIDIGKRMIQITLTPAAIADFECMEMISLYFIVFLICNTDCSVQLRNFIQSVVRRGLMYAHSNCGPGYWYKHYRV